MINIKEQVYNALKSICENVSDNYIDENGKMPSIQYLEDENKVYENTDGKEDKSYVRYKIEIRDNQSVSQYALEADKNISKLGLQRVKCQDVPESNGLKHKVMLYEGIIDNETYLVYQGKRKE